MPLLIIGALSAQFMALRAEALQTAGEGKSSSRENG